MWNFILYRGILGFGVLFSILTVAMDGVLNHPLEDCALATRLPVQVFLGGLIFRYAAWWNNEKKYWRLRASHCGCFTSSRSTLTMRLWQVPAIIFPTEIS